MAESGSAQPRLRIPARRAAAPASRDPGRGEGESWLRSIWWIGLTFVLTAVAGIGGGLVWAAIAPRALFRVTGPGAATVVNPETSAFIAADGWFCVVGVAAGLLCGLAGYLAVVRRRGAPAVAALIAGSFGASLIAWWLGQSIGLSGFRAGLMAGHRGAVAAAPLTLGAHSAVVCWPFGAALAVVAAELAATRPERSKSSEVSKR